MTVKELREKLAEFPDDLEVLTKKREIFGNVGDVFGVHLDTYSFFGVDLPCVLITDYSDDDEEDEEESLDTQRAVEDTEYCERHEPTYNPDDGSM